MTTKSLNFTCGTDPEFFMVEDSTGRIVSAIGKINGTKEEPLIAPNGAELHYDNILFEMALPISNTKAEWMNINSASLRLASAMIPKGYSLSMDISSALVDSKELEHPDALVFGCSEDFNAYTLKANPTPKCEENTFRCGGGHIHVGHLALEGITQKITMTRVMDALHGLISCDIDQNEGTRERRKLYGKAGCYRPTEYGIEYRTLSNYWMGDEVTQELMYLLTRDALQIVVDEEHKQFFSIFSDEGIDVREAIDTNEGSYIVWMEEYRSWLGDDTIALLDECLWEASEASATQYTIDKNKAKEESTAELMGHS